MTSHSKIPPRLWPVQDAKARFSEMLKATVNDGPQIVTKRGVETAVLVPIKEWRASEQSRTRSLKELLLADEARFDFELPRIPYQPRLPTDMDD